MSKIRNENEVELTYENIYNKYYMILVKYVSFDLGCRHFNTIDIVQDTMEKVYNKLHTYDKEKGNFSTWIFTVARNTAFDYASKDKTAKRGNLHQDANEIEIVTPKKDDADNQMINSELKATLKFAINKLRPSYKQVTRLFFIQGFSLSEISELLEMPLGTVKVVIMRSRLEMQKTLTRTHKEYAS